MKQRCYNPYEPAFELYGELGIGICDRWRNSFENFLEDLGEPPVWATGGLDRIDPRGTTSPGTCVG